MNSSVLPRLVRILHELSPTSQVEKMTPATLLIGDLNIDSLKLAELSVMLEEEFKVPVFVPELLTQVDDPYLLNISSLVTLVEQKLA